MLAERAEPKTSDPGPCNPTPPMPSYQEFQQEHPEQFNKLVQYVASLKGED